MSVTLWNRSLACTHTRAETTHSLIVFSMPSSQLLYRRSLEIICQRDKWSTGRTDWKTIWNWLNITMHKPMINHTHKSPIVVYIQKPLCVRPQNFLFNAAFYLKRKKNVFSRTDIAWNSKYFSSKNNHVLDLCNAFYLGIH